MFSPEKNFGTPKRQEPEEFPHLSKVLEMAEKRIFANAIDPHDFIKIEGDPSSGPYEAESVKKDLELLKRHERAIKIQHEMPGQPGGTGRTVAMRQIAHAFEGIMLQADDNEWLGPGTKIIIPARYDDVENGIDGIAEFHNEGYFSHLALAMDITSSERIDAKLEGIRAKINEGELAKLRYFQSEATHVKGEKKNLPRVVVGADRQTVYDLTLLWAEGKMDKLAGHSMQIQMLSEIHHQLKAYADYSRVHAAERSQAKEKQRKMIVGVYESSRKIIDEIIQGHVARRGENVVRAMLREAEKDNVYQAMLEKLQLHFGYTPGDLLNK